MPAAVYRDFVTLLSLEPNPASDTPLESGLAWKQYAQVWAQVLPLTGTSAGAEQFTQQGVQSRVNYTVTLRYRTDVSVKDRIIYRGQPLEIISAVDPDGMRLQLSIQAAAYPGAA